MLVGCSAWLANELCSTPLNGCGPGVLIARRIKVLRTDGSSAGDFDVLVCDPMTRTAVIFEIKWGIAADGSAEVYRAEKAGVMKRSQVVRLRAEVMTGRALPKWPVGWPDMIDYQFRGYVLTRDVLATREISDDGVTIRSHQLLARTLRSGAASGRMHPPIRQVQTEFVSDPPPHRPTCVNASTGLRRSFVSRRAG
jgi:hypothetical protein